MFLFTVIIRANTIIPTPKPSYQHKHLSYISSELHALPFTSPTTLHLPQTQCEIHQAYRPHPTSAPIPPPQIGNPSMKSTPHTALNHPHQRTHSRTQYYLASEHHGEPRLYLAQKQAQKQKSKREKEIDRSTCN